MTTTNINVLPVVEDLPCSKTGCIARAVNQLLKSEDGRTSVTTACLEHTEDAREQLAADTFGNAVDRASGIAAGMAATALESGGQLSVADQTRIADLVREMPTLAVMVIAQFARLLADAAVAKRGGDAQGAYEDMCGMESQFHHYADGCPGDTEGED